MALFTVEVQAQVQATGGQVTAGAGTISQAGATTTINQASPRLAIDWNTFSSAANEAIVFNQPNAQAIALNRITGSSPSTMLGRLTANGQVFILNPNGVLFGAGSQVNVGGLVASTHSLGNADFMAGNHRFTAVPGTRGTIVNQGTLTAAPGGYIALLAPEVRNEGVVTATLGTALLAAGDRITLNLDNGSLVGYSVDQGAVHALASNQHLIQADGGQVVLTARAADALTTATVNNTGVIEARTLQNRAGRIVLLGDMAAGLTQVAGTLDASAPAGGDGGFIETSAAQVEIADATRVTTTAPAGRTGAWLIDPTDYTIAATGGNITGAALSANLASNNVLILSSGGGGAGNGDIHVNDAVSWSTNTLTLTAARDININAIMTASGTSALTLNTATANGADGGVAGGTVKVGMAPNAGGFTGRVDFGARSGTGFLTINGNGYTVINSLGAAGSVTGTDLQGLNGNLSGHYALGANIDASATSAWNAGAGFMPVNNFTGSLNGLGHTVSSLTINRPGTNTIGLFGSSSGTISNIGLVGGSVIGRYNVGSLAGQTQPGGSIRNVYSTANVSATGDEAGGLVGVNRQTITGSYATGIVTAVGYDPGGLVGWNLSGTISHSYATGNASSSATGWSGGLVGYNDAGTIDNSYATGNASSAAEIAGGLVGGAINGGTISNSYATGNATSTDASGGLVGYNNGATITNAYATGNVNATSYGAGGLVGRNLSGAITNAYAIGSVTSIDRVGGLVGEGLGNITHAYATGPVTGTTNVGGLIGRSTAGTITSSYWNKDTTGRTTSAGLADSFGKTTAELRQASTFTGWDLATTGGSSAVWRIYEGNTAPLLRNFLASLTLANSTLTYNGTAQTGASVPTSGALSGTVASGRNIGSYTAYSHQQGYDITGGALTINPASLVVATSNVTKTYDGGLSASGTAVATGGTQLFGTDTATGGTFAFTDKNAGSGNKTVTASGVTVNDGNSGANYTVSYASNTTSTITPKALTIAGVTASNKVYDGTTAATVNAAGASYTGLIGGDVVTLNLGGITGNFADKNVGTAKAINVTGLGLTGADAANYSANATTTAPADITPRNLTATATGVNKIYDGTTTATVTFGDNRIAGDTLTFSGAALFADKNAGAGKTVSVTGISVTGADLANYTLGNTTATTTANITPKALVIDGLTASNKVYDGTTAATVNGAGANYTGLIAGDVVTLNLGVITGSFTDKNVGTAKAINVTGLGLTGADAANYSANATTTATADITAAALTVTAKNYSRSVTGIAYRGGHGVTYTGFVAGETASVLTGTLTFGGSAQGAIAVGDYAIAPGGLSATNYTLSFVDGVLTITPANSAPARLEEPYDGARRYLADFGANSRKPADYWKVDVAALAAAAAARDTDKN